ncbi:hypothetical protein KK141_21245 [Dyella sp. LX-66]|uniref:hypothetical protein n=1 Tax=unclassified Dyella TaxID=2634549 RepID=UPI001BE09FA2|nr:MULTISPECIES: hypothetical protein [unclassified Dyella]MBT2119659.1 hypothetical protein [Dyella sp. LX-1]MBT2142086.1 hypothetical protein [Dyella sp. LX-66]
MKPSTLLLAALLAGSAPLAFALPHADHAAAAAPAAPKLQAALRSLWHGHIVATRDYAMAVHAHDDAKAKAAADAVVSDAKQLADAVGSFYGKPAGERMLTLLAGHWGGVKALTDASAKNDQAGAAKAMDTLSANGAEIAKFLAGANPNWPEPTLLSLLTGHVAHHATQIRQIMAGDSKGETATWAAMQQHMDTIADALAAGIAKQFPDKAH